MVDVPLSFVSLREGTQKPWTGKKKKIPSPATSNTHTIHVWYIYLHLVDFVDVFLVGDFNPFEKYDRQNGFIFPKVRDEHKKF